MQREAIKKLTKGQKMKVVFCSHFLNHHLLRFCLKMNELVEFTFIAERPTEKLRIDMGWEDMNKHEFVCRTYESDDIFDFAVELCNQADIVIAGDFSQRTIQQRIKDKKTIFYADERIIKREGKLSAIELEVIKEIRTRKKQYGNPNIYLLAFGAFVKGDYEKILRYKNPVLRFGYFPYVKQQDLNQLLQGKNSEIEILFVGRIIDWKRCDWAIKAVEAIRNDCKNIRLNIIGNTQESPKRFQLLLEYVKRKNLEKVVYFLGVKSNDEVLDYMQKANIFLFTSNSCEGWGCVLNEAMASACAVIASDKIGAVPFLLEDGVNGFAFKNNSLGDLINRLKILCDDAKTREIFGKRAYHTIYDEWNADTAAERLVEIFNAVLSGKDIGIYEKGICSIQ